MTNATILIKELAGSDTEKIMLTIDENELDFNEMDESGQTIVEAAVRSLNHSVYGCTSRGYCEDGSSDLEMDVDTDDMDLSYEIMAKLLQKAITQKSDVNQRNSKTDRTVIMTACAEGWHVQAI